MSELEKDAIVQFSRSPIMVEAVRKVLLAGLYSNGTMRPGASSEPTRNMAFSLVANAEVEYSNEQVGADLRALWAGINALEAGFNEIKRLAKVEQPPEPKEPNRAL